MGNVGYSMKRGRKLTYKQSKYALDIMQKAEDFGWKSEE